MKCICKGKLFQDISLAKTLIDWVFGKIRLQDAVTKLLSLPEQLCESVGFSSSTNVAFELSHE